MGRYSDTVENTDCIVNDSQVPRMKATSATIEPEEYVSRSWGSETTLKSWRIAMAIKIDPRQSGLR